MEVNSAFIIGAGQMGAGIAQVLAQSGVKVSFYDTNQDQLKAAIQNIEKSLAKFVEKGTLADSDAKATLARLEQVQAFPSAISEDLVIEAVVENMDVKQGIFSELSRISSPKTILASNTSSLSITKIASKVLKPERVIGMHFMNPVPLMGLVEIIRGLQTSDETFKSIIALTERIGKTPIKAEKDYPGFIVNRILVPMINEAFFVLMEGIAKPEDIDEAMRLGTNQPMGPLKLADFVGLDTCLYICETFHREIGEDKYRPCPLLRKYVEAGWLGRKTKRGVYTY